MALSYNNIVVAVDGSKEANFAFKKAKEMAKRHEATLHLVNVIDTRSFAAIEAYDRSIAERAQAHSEELLDEYKKEATEYGIAEVKAVIEHGSPKTIITRELAKLTDADLIVCGATGLNAVERFLIGSVSEAIVRSASCDVLVVRTPEQ